MEQFTMLVRDVDLEFIKKAAESDIKNNITILNETHIDKEFWQIEVMVIDAFQIYQIGRMAGKAEGYKEGLKDGMNAKT